ncbi:MAG: IS4 family transposase [bacterium]|nr:IS4 family transposase [bacterium]
MVTVDYDLHKLLATRDHDIRAQGIRQFVRRGPLQPHLLVSILLYMVRHGSRRGYARMLEAFWDEAHAFGLELPTEEAVSKQAFCQARKKLPAALVRDLLHTASDAFDDDHGSSLRWRGRRLLAVDGARRNIQPSDELRRAFGGPEGAHYPQIHVTTLFDVVGKVPLAVEVGPFGSDERAQLLRVLDRAREDDVLVLDAGYGSFDVFAALLDAGVDFACRMPASQTFTKLERFVASGDEEALLTLSPPEGSALSGTESIALRAVRVERLNDEFWVILTSLPADEFSVDDIAEAYALRWTIEEFYKLLVSDYFEQGFFHSRSADGVRQEVYAQMLFVVMTRNIAAVAADTHGVSYDELSQKAAILAVGDHLTRLVLHSTPATARANLKRLLKRIARARERLRPGRSYPRTSQLPLPRWGRNGRRGGA